MNARIYYYTGTGNSLWAARKVADELEIKDIRSMSKTVAEREGPLPETVGFVFPVYIWGLPARVLRFVKALPLGPETTIFALSVNGGQVSRTLLQLEEVLRKKGLTLSFGYTFKTPSNYIPWGGPGPKERQQKLFQAAEEKLKVVAQVIRKGGVQPVEKGPLWQRILLTGFYKMSFSRIPTMDKAFFADEKCNQCGICQKICPAGNVTVEGTKPVWHHQCEQCFACLQWCPKEAIQFGKRTIKFERYHNPEITLKDML